MNLSELHYLNPGSILDIGANVGSFSKEAKEVWPMAAIFMIEANPECAPMLKETGLPYVISLLAEDRKQVIFYQRKCGGTSTGDSIYREATDWYSDENLVETPMVTERLDSLLKGEEFDFLKIDTQGAELDILKGGKEITSKSKAILMELPVDGCPPYNIGAPTRKEYFDYMASIGFPNYKILEDIRHPAAGYIIQQDVLFTR